MFIMINEKIPQIVGIETKSHFGKKVFFLILILFFLVVIVLNYYFKDYLKDLFTTPQNQEIAVVVDNVVVSTEIETSTQTEGTEETMIIKVEEPPSGGAYQGELRITLSKEDIEILKNNKNSSILGSPAFTKEGAAWLATGASSSIYERFIGPSYALMPQNYILKKPAKVELCYVKEMVGYSSSKKIDEASAKLWLGFNPAVIQESSTVNIDKHCVVGVLDKFPPFGIGVFIPKN